METKFIADSIFGILPSESVILSDAAKVLKEPIKVKNTVDCLEYRGRGAFHSTERETV